MLEDSGFEWSTELVDRLREADTGDNVRVYLAGPVYDYSPHRRLRDGIMEKSEEYPKLEIVDPLDRDVENRQEIPPSDVDTLATCDIVLMTHVPGAETWGTPGELYLAKMADYPVVLYEVGDSIPGLSIWLESAIDREHLQIDRAIRSCLELAE